MENRHFIGTTTIDLRLRWAGAEPFAVQREADSFVKDRLLPALKALFDRLARPHETISIDRLELELPALPSGLAWQDAALREILRSVEARVLKSIDGAGSSGLAVRRPSAVGRFEQWLFFLKNGHLPAAATVAESELRRAALETVAADMAAPARLAALLTSEPAALRRLLRQHDGAFLAALAGAAAGSAARVPLEGLSAASRLFSERTTAEERVSFEKTGAVAPQNLRERLAGLFFEKFWLALPTAERRLDDALPEALAALFATLPTDGAQLAWAAFFESRIEGKPASFGMLRPVLEEVKSRFSIFQKDRPTIEGLVRPAKKTDPEQPDAGRSDGMTLSHPVPINPADLPPKKEIPGDTDLTPNRAAAMPTSSESSAHLEKTGREEPFEPGRADESGAGFQFVGQAGLVLLNPFLSPFLTGLGLVEKGCFASRAHQERAVHLLHFLATGQAEAAEFDLVFEKFLVGWPLAEPLARRVSLKKRERDEADKLLRAVVGHWKKLGSTSPDGLRGSFLCRPGKLSARPDSKGWLLQVEPSAVDVLLDALPWGFGTVKLPWLPDLLHVEWH